MRKLIYTCLCLFAMSPLNAQTWRALGPPGGDARVLATDPSRPERVFLGTADGHIFGSQDSGGHWTLLGRASSRSDAVITAIVVDPRDGNILFASSWTRNSPTGGGIFRSVDGGRMWSLAGLAGEAVRALIVAPSDPTVLIAGTLTGVYRSNDDGSSWRRISPENHMELRNLDSLAVDPGDPQIIYAGTFHLPWKTTDGGRTWSPIHQGMIDDSDVMSLRIDSRTTGRIYASACSGIYRTDDGAGVWRKIQGIPYTARRTYAITQDPNHAERVYAATSEGLWKSVDAGMTWQRTTPESWVVNTVVVSQGDPGRVLIGTEERGVLASDDAGEHFEEANTGFEHRQNLALGSDATRPGRILAVFAHAPEPFLASENGGETWTAIGVGFRAEQVLQVYSAPDHAWWIALSAGGLMRYDDAKKTWMKIGALQIDASDTRASHSKIRKSAPREKQNKSPLLAIFSDIDFHSNDWYAATNQGLLVSRDHGEMWRAIQTGSTISPSLQSVRASSDGRRIRVVSQRGLLFSDDSGATWTWHDLPLRSGGALSFATVPGDENILVALAQAGLYVSRDWGGTWSAANAGLPAAPVQGFAATFALFAAAMRTGGLYLSSDFGKTWSRAEGTLADDYFTAVVPGKVPGDMLAASATEGLYGVH
ncbi:MAG TPA: hypothetical protein VFE02_14790 [Candidatus Acidoferrales bacterium]|nr:hypothetical protein [Candidatus Acidoferrales bacterium]